MRCLLLPLLLLLAAPAMAQTWLAESAQTIASTDTGWGAIALEPGGNRLFVARRADGLLVWDTRTRQGVTVANSAGANGVVLIPDAGRGYAAMIDGTVLVFELATLNSIERTDLGAGPLNLVFYEPTQRHVHLIAEAQQDKTSWITLDATSGAVLSRTGFNSKTMDAPATDGAGAIFAPMRDRGSLQQLDARDLSIQKTWKLAECPQPAAVAWDNEARRVFIACRGEKPQLVALDPTAGSVGTVPIGAGASGLAIDAARHLIVSANGQDGSLSVVRQLGPDKYALVETVATRPMARVLALDPASDRLFTVAASYTESAPADGGKTPPIFYHPDSFTILTYVAH